MFALNDLYCVDCMEAMKEISDGFFELAIVDPPYGVGSVTYMPADRKKCNGGYLDKYNITIATLDMNQRPKTKVNVVHGNNGVATLKSFGDENVSPPPEYFKQLFRVSKNQIIWGGNYYLLPPTRCYLVWRKTTVSENFSMAICEYAWTSFNSNAKYIELAPQGTVNEPRFHPTQKPVKLYSWILSLFAKSGDKILDTHVGSASSLIACHRAGYEYLGFEIDEGYCKKAKERLEAEKEQVKLW